MESKELMIGDWVRITKSQWNKGNTYKVLDLYENGSIRTSHISPVLKDNYEPIPITEEILKANGFEKHGYWVKYIDDKEICICLSKGIPIYYYGKPWNYCFPHPAYVHELQRVLRCCGLWDLANNFKVN